MTNSCPQMLVFKSQPLLLFLLKELLFQPRCILWLWHFLVLCFNQSYLRFLNFSFFSCENNVSRISVRTTDQWQENLLFIAYWLCSMCQVQSWCFKWIVIYRSKVEYVISGYGYYNQKAWDLKLTSFLIPFSSKLRAVFMPDTAFLGDRKAIFLSLCSWNIRKFHSTFIPSKSLNLWENLACQICNP